MKATDTVLRSADGELRGLVAEAIDYVNGFSAPHRKWIAIQAMGKGGYTLGEEPRLEMRSLIQEIIFQVDAFLWLDTLKGKVAGLEEMRGEPRAALDQWTRDDLALPLLVHYFEYPEHPVVFDEPRFRDAVAAAAHPEPPTGWCTHVEPLTRIAVDGPIAITNEITIRPAERTELEDWLNPDSPFGPIVAQETIMDIGAVVTARYSCEEGDRGRPAVVLDVERLVPLLQLFLDCDTIAPFTEERDAKQLRSSNHPGVGRLPPGRYGVLKTADRDRLATGLQRVRDRVSVPGFALALRRWQGTATRGREDDALIDVWIALEALFTPDTDTFIKATVARRVSKYVADEEHRETVREEIRNSYKCRSKVVHGNELDGWNLPAVVEQTRRHLRLALLRVIEDAEPFDARNWGRAGLND